MENTIILNSGQKIEVLFQDEVSLDIDCALRYIVSGEQELDLYVKNTAKPKLDEVIIQAQTDMAAEIAKGVEDAAQAASLSAADAIASSISEAKTEVDSYVTANILPDLNSAVASAAQSAQDAASSEEASFQSAQASGASANNAQTSAQEAAQSAQSAAQSVQETATLIEEFTTSLDNKADVDLSNVAPAQSFKDMSVGWGVPDYDRAVSLTPNASFVAPFDGFVEVVGVYGNTGGFTLSIGSTNDAANAILRGAQAGASQIHSGGQAIIIKGQTYYFFSSMTINRAIMCPCKGVDNA